ncbi:hypothetical protein TBR22_A27010 [Luteitalea sp. TBR-22]|uniref:DUF4920 domain-containing protein n=1 Tax=Luteitalea sp. TBR-22 TaxID=2802971 RepID=UPI001AFA5861|nr:DUF4920 domain-containing protein [Luteitalea sp. TBR-22]BCS33474.1 hypothetical protein TBR22_A27010 [Luteitalea sp. TBR-22]
MRPASSPRRLATLVLLLAAGLLAAPTTRAAEDAGKVYGEGVTAKRAVPIAALLDKPTAHTGKTVRVDGVVTQVCQSMGCWIEIGDPALGRGVRFKAKDGVIVFPKEAVGRKVSAQGTFEEIATSPVREAHAEHARSAENSGKPPVTTPAEKIYWVRVTGAVLY